MACFKNIKKGQFFQDNQYYEFNTKHCYLKTGTYQYLDMNSGNYVDVRDKYHDSDISGEYCYRFSPVQVEFKVKRL